jgi:hypothetical protein
MLRLAEVDAGRLGELVTDAPDVLAGEHGDAVGLSVAELG